MRDGDWLLTLRCSCHLLRRAWQPMAGYTLIIWAAEVVLLMPLASWVLNRAVARSGELIVGNSELVGWLLSIEGILYLLSVGSVALLGLVIPVAGLFWIANAAEQRRSLTAKEALVQVFFAFPTLLRFCLGGFLICLVLLLPLAAGLGTVYLLLLQSHDFYYYTTVQPPAWKWALLAGGLWSIFWACAVGGLLLRWSYLLPLWLDGARPLRRALRASWEATRGSSMRLLRVLGACLAIWVFIDLILEGGLYLIAGFAVRRVGESVYGLFYTISTYLVLAGLISAITTFLGTAWGTCVLLVCYRRHRRSAGPEHDAPTTCERHRGDVATRRHLLAPGIAMMAILALLAASTVVSALLLAQESANVAPLVIAHRAGATHAPENTLAALEIAIEQGADYAEIDVQRSADGVVVVAHDADLSRMAGHPLRIRETEYARLAKIDIGKRFGTDFAGERLGTLADFLERARGRIKLLIELKYYGDDPRLVEETLSLVRQHGMEENVAIMSFRLEDVRQAQHLAPDVPVGYVASVEVGNLARLDVDFLAIAQRKARAKLIRQTQQRALPAYAWTVNDADEMLDLMEQGIDGLITDDPALAGEVIQYIRTLAPPERLLLRFRHLWGSYHEDRTGRGRPASLH